MLVHIWIRRGSTGQSRFCGEPKYRLEHDSQDRNDEWQASNIGNGCERDQNIERIHQALQDWASAGKAVRLLTVVGHLRIHGLDIFPESI
jgi:hypothetical protein